MKTADLKKVEKWLDDNPGVLEDLLNKDNPVADVINSMSDIDWDSLRIPYNKWITPK